MVVHDLFSNRMMNYFMYCCWKWWDSFVYLSDDRWDNDGVGNCVDIYVERLSEIEAVNKY